MRALLPIALLLIAPLIPYVLGWVRDWIKDQFEAARRRKRGRE